MSDESDRDPSITRLDPEGGFSLPGISMGAREMDISPPMRGLTSGEQWAIQDYLAEKYDMPPFRGVRCDFRLTAAQSAQADQLIASVDHDSISGAIVVTERLGGYLVEPGGIVCADWDGVLTAVRKAWGVA